METAKKSCFSISMERHDEREYLIRITNRLGDKCLIYLPKKDPNLSSDFQILASYLMKAVFDELITGYWDKSLHKLYCKDWDSPETLDTIFFAVVRLLPPESIRDYYLNLQPRFLVGV